MKLIWMLIVFGCLTACGGTPTSQAQANLIVVYPAHQEIPELWAFLQEVGQEEFVSKLRVNDSRICDVGISAEIRPVLLSGTIEIRVSAQSSAGSLGAARVLSEAVMARSKKISQGRFEVRVLDEPRLIGGAR